MRAGAGSVRGAYREVRVDEQRSGTFLSLLGDAWMGQRVCGCPGGES